MDINIFPKFLDEAISPIAQSVGKTVSNLWQLGIGSHVEYWAQKQSIRQSQALEKYRQQIENKMSTIPEENLVEPELHIIGPALEASKYYVQNEELRNMFANLIASSMDSRKIQYAHPSFVEIIKQMSPIDAINLKIFIREEVIAICKIIYQIKKGGYNIQATNVISHPNATGDPQLLSSSFNNLDRLGLISISYDEFLKDDGKYSEFYSHPLYIEASNRLNVYQQQGIDSFTKVDLIKGMARRTPLGLDFIKACII
jgi:hypothetical protein